MVDNIIPVLTSKDLDNLASVKDKRVLLTGLSIINSFSNKCRINNLSREEIVQEGTAALDQLSCQRVVVRMSNHDYYRIAGLVDSIRNAYLREK